MTMVVSDQSLCVAVHYLGYCDVLQHRKHVLFILQGTLSLIVENCVTFAYYHLSN